jgi:hypothetical protein
MIFENALCESDKVRADRTLRKLVQHDISRWALTGGFATETYVKQNGGASEIRSLNDIDFIVSSFDCIPESLTRDFLLRHVHPNDPLGKTLLQCVDEETGVRVDVFRAYGAVMSRVQPIDLTFQTFRIVSKNDLTARAARLSWNLCEGQAVAPKYVRDFLRLLELSTTEEIESVWQDHRQFHRPESFATVAAEIRRALAARPELLVSPAYSTDPNAVCERCVATPALPLVDAHRILAILGYC